MTNAHKTSENNPILTPNPMQATHTLPNSSEPITAGFLVRRVIPTKFFAQLLPRNGEEWAPVSKSKQILGIDPRGLYRIYEFHPELFDYMRPKKGRGLTLHIHIPSYRKYREDRK